MDISAEVFSAELGRLSGFAAASIASGEHVKAPEAEWLMPGVPIVGAVTCQDVRGAENLRVATASFSRQQHCMTSMCASLEDVNMAYSSSSRDMVVILRNAVCSIRSGNKSSSWTASPS